MDEERTTAAVQRYLNELAGDAPAEPIVRALLDRAVSRLQILCGNMLYRSYPRLGKPPLNLQADELLGAVVERLLKALRGARPKTVREFFALANMHMRWELNGVARRLDKQPSIVELQDVAASAESTGSSSEVNPEYLRMLNAIDQLPAEEREVFELVRIQGLTQPEVAEVLGVSTRTVQRRLNHSLQSLAELLEDLRPDEDDGERAGK